MINHIPMTSTAFASAASAQATLTVMSPDQFIEWVDSGPLACISLNSKEVRGLALRLAPIDEAITLAVTLEAYMEEGSLSFGLSENIRDILSDPDFAEKVTAAEHREHLAELVDYIQSLRPPVRLDSSRPEGFGINYHPSQSVLFTLAADGATTLFTKHPGDFLRTVLDDLRHPQDNPAPLFLIDDSTNVIETTAEAAEDQLPKRS